MSSFKVILRYLVPFTMMYTAIVCGHYLSEQPGWDSPWHGALPVAAVAGILFGDLIGKP